MFPRDLDLCGNDSHQFWTITVNSEFSPTASFSVFVSIRRYLYEDDCLCDLSPRASLFTLTLYSVNFQSPLRCGSISVSEDSGLIGCHLHLYLTDAGPGLYMLPCVVGQWWARQGSNLRPIGYEPTALPLSYRPGLNQRIPAANGVSRQSPLRRNVRARFVITDGCS